MTAEQKSEPLQLDANGSFLTPQMVDHILEKLPLPIAEIMVHPKQWLTIERHWKSDLEGQPMNHPKVQISRDGHRLCGKVVTQDGKVPENALHFLDQEGNLLAKIIHLER